MMPVEELASLEVSGTPEETGYAIGRAVADAIHEKVLTLSEFHAVERAWRGSDYLEKLDAAARQVFPQYVLELEAMAKGAQVDYQTLFIWNCRGDLPLPEEAFPELTKRVPEGCTTLLFPAANGHGAVIAHNEDGPPELNGYCRWLTVRLHGKVAFSTFHYPGMLPGHTFSVNEHRLVQTVNNIRAHDLKPGIPRHFICRAILDCAGLEDALCLLRRTDRASGFHHSLGHTSGLLSVEAPASGCAVRKIEHVTAHANHLLAEEFSGLPQVVSGSSSCRQQMSEKLISESTYPEPKSILFHQSSQGHTVYRRPNDGGDDYAFTLATGIFEIIDECVSCLIHLNRNSQPSLAQHV